MKSVSSPWRDAGKACFTTQFGSDRFIAFRTEQVARRRLARSLWRDGALRDQRGGRSLRAAANLAHGVIDALSAAGVRAFGSEAEWMAHLAARLD